MHTIADGNLTRPHAVCITDGVIYEIVRPSV